MHRRIPSAIAFGVIAALTVGAAGSAGAQTTSSTTATSSQRIPVRKDSYGTSSSTSNGRRLTRAQQDSIAAQARADSIAAANAAMEQARQDSINAANAAMERARQDSINAANAAMERARQDSIAREQARTDSLARWQAQQDSIAAARRAMIGRWGGATFRIGGGATMPMSDTKDFFDTGFDGTIGVGYHPGNWPVGIRFDGNYDRLAGKDFTVGGVTSKFNNQAIWSGTGELTFGLPPMMKVAPYVVGGGGIYHFTNFGAGNGDGTNNDEGSVNKFGWNAGGGIEFGFGGASLFVETRYTRVNMGNDNGKVTFLPIIAGFTFR